MNLSKIHHIAIIVSDYEAAKDFYVNKLGLRLGTFQLSDIFYNTVGGVLGGLMYCAVMKVRKHL